MLKPPAQREHQVKKPIVSEADFQAKKEEK
jgi:hypothetical protein